MKAIRKQLRAYVPPVFVAVAALVYILKAAELAAVTDKPLELGAVGVGASLAIVLVGVGGAK
jgi:hypothetical protein